MNGIHSFRLKEDALRDKDFMMSLKGCCLCRHRSLDDSSFPSTASLARKKSRKVTRARSKSRESYDFTPTTSSLNNSGNLRLPPHVQSRSVSRRSSTPIMYSNSSGRLKPPPIEKKLECTLEELCYGCKKNIKITRDVITDTGLVYYPPHHLVGCVLSLIFIWLHMCLFFPLHQDKHDFTYLNVQTKK